MRTYLDTIAQVLVAVATFVLTWQTAPALAQGQQQECPASQASSIGDAYFVVGPFDPYRRIECQAPKQSAPKFAGYYAPYAIQAALAYWDDHQIRTDDFGDSTKKAERLFRQWEYQFDSSGYVICTKPGEKGCYSDQPAPSTWFGTSGLYYQVWARHLPNNRSCSEVSIAFRGTVNSTWGLLWASWSSNSHAITRGRIDDEYFQMARRIDAIMEQIKRLNCFKQSTQIVSVGHSLGGGLAEFAALATKAGRIRKVFTFNASPITGRDLIDEQTWQTNRKQLTIDRIYQEGEILANYAIQSQQQTPAFGCDPTVRTVQINAFKASPPKTFFQRKLNYYFPSAYNALGEHPIGPFAAKLVEWTDEKASYHQLPTNPEITCQQRPDYEMLPAPPPQEQIATVYGFRRGQYASAFDRARAAVQAQRLRDAYGFADPGLKAMQPNQLGPLYADTAVYPDMAERKVSVRKLIRARHQAVRSSLQATLPRTHT